MKLKLYFATILSTTAIASGIIFSEVNPAHSCSFRKDRYSEVQFKKSIWLSSPLAIILALPGIALATSLYLGGRAYERSRA